MSKLPAECSGGDKLSRICIHVLRVRRGRLCLLLAVGCAAASCHHSRRHSLPRCDGKTNSKCNDLCKRPYIKTGFRAQKMVPIFGIKTVPKFCTETLFFGTKSVPNFGTKSVPNYGTILVPKNKLSEQAFGTKTVPNCDTKILTNIWIIYIFELTLEKLEPSWF